MLRFEGITVSGALSAANLGISDLLTFLSVLVATGAMAHLERRRWSDYGLPGRNAFSGLFWTGFLFGFAAITLLILLIYGFGGYTFGPLALHGSRIVEYAFIWLLASFAVGFAEEFFFRGYPQFTLSTGIGFWPAAVVISLLFGALHYFTKPYERWPDWACTSLIALVLCLSLRRTGDLRFAIGLHAAFDYGALFVYSGPNGGRFAVGRLLDANFHGSYWLTGGPLGPEASLLVFPVIGLMFLGVHWLWPKVSPIASRAASVSRWNARAADQRR